jgi:hypothetical protein
MSGDQLAEKSGGLPVHSLYVGSRDGRAFPNADRQSVIDAIAAAFDGFTLMDADGYFQGRSVATMVIKLGTNDTRAVITLARRLRSLLAQQSVGHETGGRFYSIVMD